MTSEGRGILSPVRLPVPPLQQAFDSFEFTRIPARRTVVVLVVVLGLVVTALSTMGGRCVHFESVLRMNR